MSRFIAVAVVAAGSLYSPAAAESKLDTRWCLTRACEDGAAREAGAERARKATRQMRLIRHWRKVARPYAGWLRSTSLCESGSSGWYRLRTTGNGFWFAFQFTAGTWGSVGGRFRSGVPAGYWGERVPIPAEQKFRAVRVRWSQGRGAWPVCG